MPPFSPAARLDPGVFGGARCRAAVPRIRASSRRPGTAPSRRSLCRRTEPSIAASTRAAFVDRGTIEKRGSDTSASAGGSPCAATPITTRCRPSLSFRDHGPAKVLRPVVCSPARPFCRAFLPAGGGLLGGLDRWAGGIGWLVMGCRAGVVGVFWGGLLGAWRPSLVQAQISAPRRSMLGLQLRPGVGLYRILRVYPASDATTCRAMVGATCCGSSRLHLV